MARKKSRPARPLKKLAQTQQPSVPHILADALEDRIGVRPTMEYRFHSSRLWRLDLCYLDLKIAIEVDGTRHASISANRKDAEKRNALAEQGWIVLVYPANVVLTKKRLPRIVEQVYRVICKVNDDGQSACVLTGE